MKKVMLVLMLCSVVMGKTCYVDSSLDVPYTQTYDTTSQASTGGDQVCFLSLQSALDSMKIGWYTKCYMREGTYFSTGVVDSMFKIKYDGTTWNDPDSCFILQSYPGEWAILDGENKVKSSSTAVLGAGAPGLGYWKFTMFEIQNGGEADGEGASGFYADNGPFVLEKLIIHDCLGTVSESRPTAIEGHNWINSTIRWCYFYNNGSNTDLLLNSCHILMYSDYEDHDIALNGFTYSVNHSMKNVIEYNLIDGGATGIWLTKGYQYYTGRNDGYSDDYDSLHSIIRYNVLLNCKYLGIHIQTDFLRCYNNIIDNCVTGVAEGIQTGMPQSYKPYIFNNTVKNCSKYGIRITQADDDAYGDIVVPSQKYAFVYNNIVDSCGYNNANNYYSAISLYDEIVPGGLQDSTLINNNYIYRSDSVWWLSGNYTVANFISNVRPVKMWFNNYDSNNKLWSNNSWAYRFIPLSTHLINGDTGVANAGLGANYASYIGAVHPDSGQWVKNVLSLERLGPNWTEDMFKDRTYSTFIYNKVVDGENNIYKVEAIVKSKNYFVRNGITEDSTSVLNAGDTTSIQFIGSCNNCKIFTKSER